MKLKRPPKQADPVACCPVVDPKLVASPEHVESLKALAHLGRLQVFFYIVKAGKPVPVNEVQAALSLPGPTLSHHLDDLERAGLISRERKERFIYSQVRRDTVQELVRLLTACC